VTDLNVALAVVGGLVLVIGLFAGLMRRVPLSESLVALVVGVAVGPAGLGLIDPARWGRQEVILEQAARLTLAIGLMAVALRLPKAEPLRRLRSLATLLGLVMPLMWLSSGLLVYLIVGLPFALAMLVGAVVTPTDPVVASAIVTGKVAEENLPARVRHTISAESGFNDGLAYPFVLLPILLLTRPTGDALGHWLTRTVLWEMGMAVLFGALVGYGAGKLLHWAESRDFVEQTSFLAYTIALSLLALGAARLLGTDGLLAVFVAGIAFDIAVSGEERAGEERVQEAINHFFTLPIFVLLGAILPGGLGGGWAGGRRSWWGRSCCCVGSPRSSRSARCWAASRARRTRCSSAGSAPWGWPPCTTPRWRSGSSAPTGCGCWPACWSAPPSSRTA